MPSIDILGTGRLDERDSAFPQAVQLPNGDILCSFGVGGGPEVDGGTDWARSTDGGETWTLEGTLLAPTAEPETKNFLKLALSPDGGTVYAYGARLHRTAGQKFGEGRTEPVLCRSVDGGQTWSDPQVIPMPADCPLEISHGVLPLSSGRLLAPAATLPAKDRLGEQVLVAISDDGGKTWPRHAVVFEDPEAKLGYFEHKLAALGLGRILAAAWTVTRGDVMDRPDSFSLSNDDGATWSPARSTGINGQTLTPIPLGGDRLCVLYNRRYGHQGIVMALVTFSDTSWTVHHEDLLYDAKTEHHRAADVATGVEEFDAFAFGFPTAIRLQDGTFLATHWCREGGPFGIRWTKLHIDW